MSVLQALNGYYDRMAARNGAEAPGYSREKISFAIVLSAKGEPIDVLDLRQEAGRRQVPRMIEVPAAVTRTVRILPNLLWDKTAYVFGRTAGEGRRITDEHAAFKIENLAISAPVLKVMRWAVACDWDGRGIEKPLQHIGSYPVATAREDGVPAAEQGRQVAQSTIPPRQSDDYPCRCGRGPASSRGTAALSPPPGHRSAQIGPSRA